MPENFKIELTADSQAVLDRMKEYPAEMKRALARGMDRANQYAIAFIQRMHLTGQGPFPPDQHMLGVRTNRLRSAVWAAPTRVEGKRVSSIIGDNVKYAALHEFGGTVQRKARAGVAQLKMKSNGELMRQAVNKNLAVFASKRTKHRKSVAYVAKAHMAVYPERAPFRTGLNASRPEYTRSMSEQVMAAWKRLG